MAASKLTRVRFVHWKPAEAVPKIQALVKAGFKVEYTESFDSTQLRACRQDPPSVICIDLSRLPSHGREVAIALRQSAKTRSVPIVFCDGDPEKIAAIKAVLPDAHYCLQGDLAGVLRRVKPVDDPVRPADMMNRYGTRTVAEKLGIKPGCTLTARNSPRNIQSILGGLPAGARFCDEGGDVTLCFISSIDELREELSSVRGLASQTRLWILWRKKGAAGHAGVTENSIRDIALDLGLVDYKVCAVDETWSALALARRKTGSAERVTA